jgi:hypothetical protein
MPRDVTQASPGEIITPPSLNACFLESGKEWMNMALQDFVEEVQVMARDLVDRVKALIHEGNVRRVIIKDDKGNTFIEIPVTVAAIGVIAAPVLAAVGAISALVAKFTIVVERSEGNRQ